MNKQLQKIYRNDQKDRRENLDWKLIIKRDKERRKEVRTLLKTSKIKSGIDFFYASIIFQHGPSLTDSRMAMNLASKSMKLGCKKAKRMSALALDRYLIKNGKKQRFGTQYFKKSPKDKWKLDPVERKTTDEERTLYNIEPLAELKSQVAKLNRGY